MNNLPPTDSQTPRQLLPVFYKQYDLEYDGGQSLPYVKVEFLKNLVVYIPNFEVRKKAIFKHDVHHIVTGYTSTFRGETEIGAWEIGSGVRKYWIALLLDLQAVMIGILFNPAGVFKAFVKGRHTRNLYAERIEDEDLMDMPIEKIKAELLLSAYNPKNKTTVTDVLLFLLMLLVGLIYSILSILLLPLVIFYSLYIFLTKKSPGNNPGPIDHMSA